MKPKTILILLILFWVAFYFRNEITDFYWQLRQKISQNESITPSLEKLKTTALDILNAEKEIFAPPPLRAPREAPQSFLTQAGVIKETNFQRANNELPLLVESETLNTEARAKAQDMFQKQYFAHVSPSGIGPGNLAENFGYEFVVIGENLALGNFADDKELVQGWMDSPGHRANILNIRYTEIGAATVKGIFEGKSTWIAVQEFGLPLSSCPEINPVLKSEIGAYEYQIGELARTLELKRAELEAIRPRRSLDYTLKLEEYNRLVNQYNALVNKSETLISDYNNQVYLFNECISGP